MESLETSELFFIFQNLVASQKKTKKILDEQIRHNNSLILKMTEYDRVLKEDGLEAANIVMKEMSKIINVKENKKIDG